MPKDKKQIYIVDDDASVCRALSMMLTTYGFTVNTFNSTDAFISAVSKDTPGCLILDIHMPGFDGWESQRHLLISESSRPVIIISADKDEAFKEKALNAGAAGYLQKPFNDQELVDFINGALEKKTAKEGR